MPLVFRFASNERVFMLLNQRKYDTWCRFFGMLDIREGKNKIAIAVNCIYFRELTLFAFIYKWIQAVCKLRYCTYVQKTINKAQWVLASSYTYIFANCVVLMKMQLFFFVLKLRANLLRKRSLIYSPHRAQYAQQQLELCKQVHFASEIRISEFKIRF